MSNPDPSWSVMVDVTIDSNGLEERELGQTKHPRMKIGVVSELTSMSMNTLFRSASHTHSLEEKKIRFSFGEI